MAVGGAGESVPTEEQTPQVQRLYGYRRSRQRSDAGAAHHTPLRRPPSDGAGHGARARPRKRKDAGERAWCRMWW